MPNAYERMKVKLAAIEAERLEYVKGLSAGERDSLDYFHNVLVPMDKLNSCETATPATKQLEWELTEAWLQGKCKMTLKAVTFIAYDPSLYESVPAAESDGATYSYTTHMDDLSEAVQLAQTLVRGMKLASMTTGATLPALVLQITVEKGGDMR